MKLFIRLLLIVLLLGLPSVNSDAMIVRNSRGGGITSVEGTAVLSTGEAAGTKFLREDGDGTSSWQPSAGGGDVSKVGTPVNDQVGVWTGDGTLEGDVDMTFDGTTLDVARITQSSVPVALGLASVTDGAVAAFDGTGGKQLKAAPSISASSIEMPVTVNASGSEVTITDVTGMNQVYKISAAVDVNIPTGLCDTATGHWLTVKANGANVVSIRSLDASNLFELADGTQTTAGDELDTAGSDGNMCYVICDEAETWTVYGQIGTCADGGAGD